MFLWSFLFAKEKSTIFLLCCISVFCFFKSSAIDIDTLMSHITMRMAIADQDILCKCECPILLKNVNIKGSKKMNASSEEIPDINSSISSIDFFSGNNNNSKTALNSSVIRVVFKHSAPFVFFDEKSSKYQGVMIDLWSKVAQQYKWKYIFDVVTMTSNAAIETFVSSPKKYDVLIGDFTLTWNRITRYNVSFTTPFINEGLLLLRRIPPVYQPRWWLLKSFTFSCWIMFFIFIIISAAVIWFVEHWRYGISSSYMYHHCCCQWWINMINNNKTDVNKYGNTEKGAAFFDFESIDGERELNISSNPNIMHAECEMETLSVDAQAYKKCSADTRATKYSLVVLNENSNAVSTKDINDDDKSAADDPMKKKKFSYRYIAGNTLSLFWFAGSLHPQTTSGQFLVSFLKLWVLVMSSFYLANLTALRTIKLTNDTDLQTIQDMWHTSICTKANSFIAEFLIDDLIIPDVITCEKQIDCIYMLRTGVCNGFVSSAHWIQYIDKLHADLEIVGSSFRPEFSSWIVKRKAYGSDNKLLTDINYSLIRLKSDGYIERLYKKYVDDIPAVKTVITDIDEQNKEENENANNIIENFTSDDFNDGDEYQVDIFDLSCMWVGISFAWIVALVWEISKHTCKKNRYCVCCTTSKHT